MSALNGNVCVHTNGESKKDIMADFIRPDQPSKCTWKPQGDKTKTVHTVRPL